MEERILQAIEGLNKRFDSLESRVGSLETKMESRMDSLETKMESRMDSLEIQVKENTQILKALEHSAQVNKAEHDKMFMDIAEIRGDVKGIRKDLSAVEVVTANNWSDIAKIKAIK